MILSPYVRKDSPFVWIQFAAEPGQPKRYRKTGVRKDLPARERQRAVDRELANLERELRAGGPAIKDGHQGWLWVDGFLRGRYSSPDQLSTLKVYLKQWEPLATFFDELAVVSATQIERQDAYDYLAWRTAQRKVKSGKLVAHNTARGELKLLGLVLDEAVARGYVATNPTRKLRIGEQAAAMKPEISAAEETRIREALSRHPEWMQLAFHVGISTGLRFGNCCLLASQVRWDSDDVLIERPKGGTRREFSIPIYDAVRPQLEAMRGRRARALYEIPAAEAKITGLIWRRFFDEIGLPHVCFHCTRVTFVSRGMRAGIPEPVMMRMVNHGSKLINRVYQRWTSDDVRQWAQRLGPAPGGPAATR